MCAKMDIYLGNLYLSFFKSYNIEKFHILNLWYQELPLIIVFYFHYVVSNIPRRNQKATQIDITHFILFLLFVMMVLALS